MSILNIIVIGDIHFKISNISESELFIKKITEIVYEKKPDFIVLLGDILDTFEKIHTSALNIAYEFIDSIRSISKTYIIVGNHDMVNIKQFLDEKNHWMNALKEWKNVLIIDKAIKEVINNHIFVFTPYVFPGVFIDALNTVGDVWLNASCIFAHQEIFNCQMGAYLSIQGDKWKPEYPNLISGHIHLNQKIQENVYYPGASMDDKMKTVISCITFKGENKHYELEEIDLKLPKEKTLYMSINEIEDYKITETQDKIKIVIHGEYNEYKTFKKSAKYKKLVSKNIKISYKPKKIEIKIKNEKLSKIIEKNTNDTSNFFKIINNIIEEENDSYLNEIFNNVFEIENDIIFV